ncbi:Guanyl-specific ribonuclease F1 [Madurella mycetomatis]|uniref:Guanyl-specific ribonuclease F1 n=1 Tax=Madurella mycetomatis TaxID=100816 RepID=A0A175VP11_9PEZI|nr:Guanyl-specific ribonuclease F1 [Madurella mycetomatis]
MLSPFSLLTVALYAAAAAAAADLAFDKRQGTTTLGNVTCGTQSYSAQQVNEATAEGCRLHAAGQQIGSSRYPHRFNNREGLVFATSGPYQEFPILESGVYTGRAPGPDRIVFDPDHDGSCVYVGAMTHTGASSRNGFVSCDETSVRSDPRPSNQPGASPSQSTSAPSPTQPDSGATQSLGLGGQGVAAGLLAWLLFL